MTLANAAVEQIPAGLVVPRFLYYFFAVYFVAFVALWVTHRFLLWKKSSATPKIQPDEAAWWLKPLANHEAELATDAAGLTSAEARSRLAEFGPNLFHDRQQQSLISTVSLPFQKSSGHSAARSQCDFSRSPAKSLTF